MGSVVEQQARSDARPLGRANAILRAVGLAWLLCSIPPGLVHRPTDSDFQQFYMAGLVVRAGESDDLYPIPKRESRDNPGMRPESDLRPAYARLQAKHAVPDITRWMLPPPSALLFIPFSYVPYRTAEWAWVALLILGVWGVSLLAGTVHREIVGRPTIWIGLLSLLICLSPMACRSIRIRNVTPLLALAIGMATLALLRRRDARAGVWIVLGALLKYATLILLPLALAMRRGRALAWTFGLGAGITVVAFVVMGARPFEHYFREIAPTLVRPSGFPGNQTVAGLLQRETGMKPLAPGVRRAFLAAAGGTFLAVFGLIARRRRDDWTRPALVFAAAAALVSWLMMFGPVAWEHWPIFLCPSWGWLAWEAEQSAGRRLAAALAIALTWVPLSIFTNDGFLKMDLVLPEPWNSSQLIGVAVTLGLAMLRLASPTPPPSPGDEGGAAPR